MLYMIKFLIQYPLYYSNLVYNYNNKGLNVLAIIIKLCMGVPSITQRKARDSCTSCYTFLYELYPLYS